jgi:hypothetical protein
MKKLLKIAFLSAFTLGIFLGPFSPVLAQETPSQGEAILNDQNFEDRIQDCTIFSGEGLVACFVNLFYYVILYPSGKFAQLTAELLDFFIAYSISSGSYSSGSGQFIEQGWGVIRDVANVLFIFLLLYIAIRHVLGMGSSGTKKLLTNLIVAALLINFSLFFSRVVIDAGNILARTFYNNIEVQNDDFRSGEGVKTISQALASKVQPQKLLSSDLFDPSNYVVPGEPLRQMPNGYAFFIMLMAAVVNITMGIIFLSTFLMFMGRVIGLWFMMVFSPIAFASLALPGQGSMFGQFGWNGWKDNILKLSFMAPVFMFFLFLTIMFLNIVLGSESILAGNQTTGQRLAAVLIPFITIILLLRQAKKVAADMAGEFGSALTGVVGKIAGGTLAVTGTTLGLALGGAASLGRKTIGASASRELASGINQRRVAQFNNLAKAAEARGDSAKAEEYRKRSMSAAERVSKLKSRSESSFDLRRSEFLQKQIVGSKLGQLAGRGFQEVGSAAFGGQKLGLDLGKAKDTSVYKQESEKKKQALEEAKLYDTSSQNEQKLALIGYTARKGMIAQDELIKHLDEYVEEIKKDRIMSIDEKIKRLDSVSKWRTRAQTATKDEELLEVISGIVERDEKGNVVKYDGKDRVVHTGTDGEAKEFARQAKIAFADVFESREQGVNRAETQPDISSVIADEIRKGPKKDIEKTLKDLIEENSNSKPKTPEPEKPKEDKDK